MKISIILILSSVKSFSKKSKNISSCCQICYHLFINLNMFNRKKYDPSICYFCKKRPFNGIPGEMMMYKVISHDIALYGVHHTNKYIKKNILIERCSRCEKIQNNSSIILLLFSLIVGIITMVLIWEHNWFLALFLSLPAYNITYRILYYLLGILIPHASSDSIFYRKHPKVKEHYEDGWRYGDAPKSALEDPKD